MPGSQNFQGGGPTRTGDPNSGTRQITAEMRERLRELQDLRRQLGRNGGDLARDLDRAIQQLQQLSDNPYRDDMQTALRLKTEVIDPLREVEVELSRRLQAKLGKNNLRLADEGAAPERYRKLVDEYYKRLSNRAIKQ
jgi:hypothetical protein